MAAETAATLKFDPDALREKYRQERDKRLRKDGNAQYLEVVGEFSHFLEDPYVKPIERAALHDDVEVLVIGGGFAGLLIGARLRQSGIEDIRIVEKGGDFGGTWYWNRYPGAACDTEAYIYLPLLEETGYIPTEKYAKAPEILAHSRRIAEHYDLYRNVLFQTQITELRWDDAASRWIVSTDRGDRFTAQYVCMANGPLNRPKLPGVPGVGSFKGHSFHTSRWDYAYTGGDSYGNLTGLKDKRVGIIGTGATAVQCVPHVGASAKHTYLFQRTPSSIDVRANRPTDPDWAKSLRLGLAAPSHGEFLDADERRLRRRRSRDGRLDRDHRQTAARPRLEHRSRVDHAHARDGRLRKDGTGAGARRSDRQRSEHSGSAEAVLPPVLQAAVLPRRVSRHLQSPERDARAHRRQRHRAHHRDKASSRTASNTNSIASSSRAASKWARHWNGVPVTKCTDAAALH